MSTVTTVQPEGWVAPKGYANGVVATGKLLLVGGQIGWNPRSATPEFPATFEGQFEQALEHIDKAISRFPKEGSYPLLRGRILLEMKRVDLARESFAKAIELAPEAAEPHYYLGIVLQRWDELDKAAAEYAKAAELAPSQLQYVAAECETLVAAGRLDDAQRRLDAVSKTFEFSPVLDRVRAGEADPPCTECGGILKSDTISFGQSLIPEVIDGALKAAQETDLLFAIGTSLQVFPIANAVPIAQRAGARIVIMNAQPTQFDDVADVKLEGLIGEDLPRICGRFDAA